MGYRKHPRRGSMGFAPRVRAKRETARVTTWPEISDGPRLQGFAGYKAGMTHVLAVDPRAHSTTSGQEIQLPVTVVEVPPMRIVGVRYYSLASGGLFSQGETWAKKVDKELERRLPLPEASRGLETPPDAATVEDVRVLAITQPKLVTGIPKKRPELMEVRVGGGIMPDRMKYALELIGKEVRISDFGAEGKVIDIIAVTTGKGFQGVIKRRGVRLLTHKNSKHRRMLGTLGPKHPDWVRPTVPQAGQTGYHQRTEHNKRILKIGERGEEVTPAGGFIQYGIVRNPYVLIHGSVPGPVKRLVRFRDPARPNSPTMKWETTYISTESKQGG